MDTATSITDLGSGHYRLTPGPAFPTKPIDVMLDDRDRVVAANLTLTIGGRRAATHVRFSDFNQPVTITTPPASQIGG